MKWTIGDQVGDLFKGMRFPASTEEIKTYARHNATGSALNQVERLNSSKVYDSRDDLGGDIDHGDE